MIRDHCMIRDLRPAKKREKEKALLKRDLCPAEKRKKRVVHVKLKRDLCTAEKRPMSHGKET